MGIEMFILFIAGITAGLVTGLFGGSATITVVPILVVLAGYHPYMAIGLALAVDVFSSFAALYIYRRHDNVALRPALPLFFFALVGVVLGSIYSVDIPGKVISILVGFGVIFASVRFISNNRMNFGCSFLTRHGSPLAIVWGLLSGIMLGVLGGGGGVILVLALTMFLGYRTHSAIGTSIFGMILLALAGAIGHYIHMPFTLFSVFVAAVGGILGAVSSSCFANRLSERWLNRIVAIFLGILGIGLFLKGLGVY